MTRKKKLKKPSEILNLYSQKLNQGIEERLSPLSFELNFGYRSPHIVHISGYILFKEGLILEFDEILEQKRLEIYKLKYRYHLMDKSKKLIFRYDNVAHHRELKTFPHHKHIKNKVIESENVDLLEVVNEIEKLIIRART